MQPLTAEPCMRARFRAAYRPSCSRYAEPVLGMLSCWKWPKFPTYDQGSFRLAVARAAKQAEHPLQGTLMGFMAGRWQGKRLVAESLTTNVQES